MPSISEGFLRCNDTGSLVVEDVGSATTVEMLESLPRETAGDDTTNYAVITIDIGSAVTPVLHGSWLLDDGTDGQPLVTVDIGSAVTPVMHNRLLRDEGNQYAIVTVDEGSAVTPVVHNGFLQDEGSSYALVTAGGVVALPQMNLTQVASDLFNRANGAIAGSNNWLAISTGGMNIVSHEAIGTASTQLGNYRDSAAETYDSDQYAQCTMGSAALAEGDYIALSVRNQDDANNYQMLYIQTGASAWTIYIYKKVAGSYTQLASGGGTLPGALSSGTTITFIAEGDVLSTRVGTSATYYSSNVAVIDDTFTGGTPGIESYGAASLDNWQGGNAATGPLGAAIASDNFNRADGLVSDGQANWTDLTTTFSSVACDGASISGDAVTAPDAQHYCDFRNETFSDDQWAKIGKGAVTPSGIPFNMGLVRWNGTSGYIGGLFDDPDFPGIQIYSITENEASTLLGSAITDAGSAADGTTYTMVVTGTRLSVRLNGKEVLALTDSSFTAGAPGFMLFGVTDADNFAAGNT